MNCVSIEGATSASYTLVAADLGFTLRARVIASNVAGKSYRGSLPTAVVEAALPLPGGAPCGTATAPPTGGWEHVVWIVFERTRATTT